MRSVSRRRLLAWAGGLAALTAVGACGPNVGQPAPGQKAAEPTKPATAATKPAEKPADKPAAADPKPPAAGKMKLTLYNGIGGANQRVYENWAKEFSEQNPQYDAETVTVVGGQQM